MENVKEVVSGGKYLWVMGDVVLKRENNGVVVPLVVNTKVHGKDTPEEVLKVLSAKTTVPSAAQWREKFLMGKESVWRWGYDLNAYSAYSVKDTDKYVWYTGGSDPKLLFRYKDNIYVGALGTTQDANNLVGITKYMFSEEELENSVFDPDKFLAVGENGLLVRGKGEANSSTPTNRPQYRMSEEFYKLHDDYIVAITIDNKEQADILNGLLPIDEEYHAGDSEVDSSDALVVYPEHTGYGADFTMKRHFGKYPIMTFAEAVVELTPATLSAPYVTANGTALDLSHTPISAGNSHDVGKLTSSKITLVYKTTDKFKEALRKGTVLIPVENDKEAAILSTVFEIDHGFKYHSEYSGGALIVSKGLPAMFGPYLNLPCMEEIAFGDAVEGDSTTPYTSF